MDEKTKPLNSETIFQSFIIPNWFVGWKSIPKTVLRNRFMINYIHIDFKNLFYQGNRWSRMDEINKVDNFKTVSNLFVIPRLVYGIKFDFPKPLSFDFLSQNCFLNSYIFITKFWCLRCKYYLKLNDHKNGFSRNV